MITRIVYHKYDCEFVWGYETWYETRNETGYETLTASGRGQDKRGRYRSAAVSCAVSCSQPSWENVWHLWQNVAGCGTNGVCGKMCALEQGICKMHGSCGTSVKTCSS